MTIRATLRNNSVLLTADNESRAELAEIMRGYGSQHAEMYVADELHEAWEFVAPEEVGALTDAPILADCSELERDDMGNLIAVGKVCWYPDYAIRDPWAELRNKGRTVFALAPEDCTV